MNTSLRDDLLRHLDEGSTGSLSVTARGGNLKLYVMGGEILASESPEDDIQLLRRVVVAGLLDRSRASELMRNAARVPISEQLYDALAEDKVQDLLFDRFRENIGTWLTARSPVEYEQMDAIFVPNIQIGHDSRALVGELEVVLTRTAPLRSNDGFSLRLIGGPLPPRSEDERRLREAIGAGRTVADVVRASPFDELDTLNRLVHLMDERVISRRDSAEEKTIAPEDDAPAPEETPTNVQAPKRSTSMASNFHAHDMGEEMSLFEDNDQTRGGDEEDRLFIHKKEDLKRERVELPSSRPSKPKESVVMPIEAVEADGTGVDGRSKFGAPTLTSGDAMRKIRVANEILHAMSNAFDQQNGQGSGPSQVQLLLDGCPSEFAALFKPVEALSDGTASPEDLLRNLRRRPNSEHRRLLNRALTDLIERALDVSFDGLEDDSADVVLEASASFRQRLGI